MKFAEHLGAHITPEWRKQYIQYDTMKLMLYEAVEQAPSSETTDESTIQRFYSRFTEKFLQFCDRELAKINTFFLEKLSEATRKYASLKAELQQYNQQENQPSLRKRNWSVFKEKKVVTSTAPSRKLHDLKLAFSEFYLSLILLQNYQTLNFTGFRKILKKHDKLIMTTIGAEWRQTHVETAPFYTNKEVETLISNTESIVTVDLEGGNRQRAMKRLRVPPLGDQQHPWTSFRLGLFMGMFFILLVTIIIGANFIDHTHDWEPAMRMFRGQFMGIFAVFLIGVNTYGWRSSGVNHVLIFEIDPRNHLSHAHLLELATMLLVVWSCGGVLYIFSPLLRIPPMIMPLTVGGIFLLFLFNPFKFCYHRARRWLLRILFHILTAPGHHVGFADFWLADQLNSLTSMLLDIEYTICYYAFEVPWLPNANTDNVCLKNVYGVRAVVSCLPAWFRFAQCLRRYHDTKLAFPHIVNAGKYSTTFFVVLFQTIYKVQLELKTTEPHSGVFFGLSIVAMFVSTCYTYTWDIKMDWGLLDKNAGENRFLREEIVYASKGYYYFAIVEDFLIRFKWVFATVILEFTTFNSEILGCIMDSLEVFRRFIWNFFRLENEHLNNCGQFRAVRDISIGPIQSSSEQQVIDLMDDSDTADPRGADRRKSAAKLAKEGRLWVDDDDEKEPLMPKMKAI